MRDIILIIMATFLNFFQDINKWSIEFQKLCVASGMSLVGVSSARGKICSAL